jgi:hypothetical protein
VDQLEREDQLRTAIVVLVMHADIETERVLEDIRVLELALETEAVDKGTDVIPND